MAIHACISVIVLKGSLYKIGAAVKALQTGRATFKFIKLLFVLPLISIICERIWFGLNTN